MSEASQDAAHGNQDALIQLESPTGAIVRGTLERLCGRGEVYGFRRGPAGAITPEFSGRTDVFWDEQQTERTSAGELLVIDSAGQVWPLGACRPASRGT